MLGGLFAPQSQAEFKEVKSELFRGHKTVVFDFRVRTPNSRSQIADNNTGREIISATRAACGLILSPNASCPRAIP